MSLFVSKIVDDTLTAALCKPERLADMPTGLFLRDYGSLFLDPAHHARLPTRAIMIDLEQDPVAARVAGALVSVASFVVGIGLKAASV